ncbi:MAG: SpoIID/LytB domain-containing protein [Bryobacteraceae bacterium]|nr:SpoIID/LytB domain-containing protein [Bryobacteraceae bacterium]
MRLAFVWLAFGAALAAQTEITVRVQNRTLKMPLEEYVAGVLAGEVNIFRSEEALKAAAVVARTYALRFRGRHKAEGFDFCETTRCQDLRLDAVNARVTRAAEETEGELLWYQGALVAAFYHRHCGGRTEAASELWPDMAAPYLRVQSDTYCIARGRDEWSASISARDLQQALSLDWPVGSVEVRSRTHSGRVRRLRIDGQDLTADALHIAVGRALGWHLLKSASYEVFSRSDKFLFQGYGSGHGVGLCQAGAEQRGEDGQNYAQILSFYYPGTVIGINARGFRWRLLGGERVDVFSTREAEERELVAIADRMLAEAERRAGFRYAGRPRLRVYPTVAAFRDATGEPGQVAGSTVGSTIRLQPSPALRSLGTLESTVLHEMLHVVLESRAHPSLPEWFREGLTLYLAEPGGSAASNAYRQWRSRVASLVSRHGRDTVLRWLGAGLPPGVTDDSGQR